MKRITVAILMLLFLCGCKQTETSPDDNTIPDLENVSDINNLISLSQGVSSQALTIGKHFNIVLVNNSNKTIIFPSDYNLHLFVHEGDELVEVTNKIDYPQSSTVTLVPFSEGGLENIIVNPTISTTEGTVIVRIVVSGYTKGDILKTVGAYIDLTLTR